MLLRSILEDLCDWLWGGDYESEGTVVLDVPACKQLDGHSCGLEVTRAALRYFGRRPSRLRLRKLLGTTRCGGTSEDAIQTVLEALWARYADHYWWNSSRPSTLHPCRRACDRHCR